MKKVFITHTGYRTTCPSCKSVFVLEYKDIHHNPSGDEYVCPCCHIGQYFKKDKRNKETWETQELVNW